MPFLICTALPCPHGWPDSDAIFIGNEYSYPRFHLMSFHRVWCSPPSLYFEPDFLYVKLVSCRQPGDESSFIIQSDFFAIFRPFTSQVIIDMVRSLPATWVAVFYFLVFFLLLLFVLGFSKHSLSIVPPQRDNATGGSVPSSMVHTSRAPVHVGREAFCDSGIKS